MGRPGAGLSCSMRHDFRYCPRCATELAPIAADEDGGAKTRLRCPACAYTHWNNPTPVLAAVIECADRDGQLLLARLWLIPHDGLFFLVPFFAVAALVFGIINRLLAARLLSELPATTTEPENA